MFSETVTAAPIATPHAYAAADLKALAYNTSLLAGRTSAAVMAVVKADGFGHGAVQVATTTLASGATWLGVTTCAEALHLRDNGVTGLHYRTQLDVLIDTARVARRDAAA